MKFKIVSIRGVNSYYFDVLKIVATKRKITVGQLINELIYNNLVIGDCHE